VPLFRQEPRRHWILAIATAVVSSVYPLTIVLVSALRSWAPATPGSLFIFVIAPVMWCALGYHAGLRFGACVFGIVAAGVSLAYAAVILPNTGWSPNPMDQFMSYLAVVLGWFVFFLVGQAARHISRRFPKVSA
jgi:hypothetical protein